MSSLTPVFCDYATLTTPPDCYEDVLATVRPLLEYSLFAYDISSSPDFLKIRSPSGGLFTARPRKYGVSIYQFSGKALHDLRTSGYFSLLFAEFARFPHKVTTLDLTVDEARADVSGRLLSIYEMAARGEVSFTRKALQPSHVRRIFAPCLYSPADETGTVNLGLRANHEVFAKCYDKRQERLQNEGFDMGYGVLRHELTVRGEMAPTLRDIVEPTNCFWHFYPANILTTPRKEAWQGYGEGFEVKRPEKRLPSQILAFKVGSSLELDSLIRLSDEIGENGFNYFIQLLKGKRDALAQAALAA